MRIRPLRTLLARWRAARRDRAVDAAWQADVAEQEAIRRQVLAALDAHDERRRLGGSR
jgi:hypothetical protein